ncbi:nucleoside diphosphate kinase 6-like isoform X2 [Watersipora subatra]
MNSTFGLTLALVKPSTLVRPHAVQSIIELIRKENIYIIQRKQTLLSPSCAAEFYREHEGKFFYNRLVTYMTSGPLLAFTLAGNDIVTRWRALMGPTKVYKTQHEVPSSIRGRYGISDTRNATHGSDSSESALTEIKFFFPEFDAEKW